MLISCHHTEQRDFSLDWKELPAIPDTIGFAGSYGGVANGALVVAGGANFPDGGVPWKGSEKVWHDAVFVLENENGVWKKVGRLPDSLAYGVSVTWKEGVVLAGGGNAREHSSKVWYLQYERNTVTFKKLPDLPKPIANATGIILADVLYIMGGTSSPSAKETEHNFWALDLNNESASWQVLAPWPGPSRMLAVAAAQGESLFLFSWAELKDGKRHYLKDAYRYHSKDGWKSIAALPKAVVAAPGPAYSIAGQILIFGGDDGMLAALNEPDLATHPGFSNAILLYDVADNTWESAGLMPKFPAVTAPLVCWNNELIIAGGEIKPSVRTTRVLAGAIKKE